MVNIVFKRKKENCKSRRMRQRGEHYASTKAQCDADRATARKIDAAFEKLSAGCSLNVARATHLPGMRDEKEYPLLQSTLNTKYQKVTNEAGRQIHATQKMRGKSIPLI